MIDTGGMRNLIYFSVVCLFVGSVAIGQEAPLALWPDGPPMSNGEGEGHEPTITPYLPAPYDANGVAVVVCPGGGYGGLAMDHEGDQIGKWLNGYGVAAFVLTYRHGPHYKHPVPRMDVQRAIRIVRSRAEDWRIDDNKIGVLGFSAGGHLTATAVTQFDERDAEPRDAIDEVSARPDFGVLMYPVITMTDPFTHSGSRKNLLGASPSEAMIDLMSMEKNVTENTPPCFIVHTTEDGAVPVQNALLFYGALVDKGVPAELHIFNKGRHGLGLGEKYSPFAEWPQLCMHWLRDQGLLYFPNK